MIERENEGISLILRIPIEVQVGGGGEGEGDLRLRGQMVYLAEQEKLLFLGSPWMTEMATLQKLGLTADDFSLILNFRYSSRFDQIGW